MCNESNNDYTQRQQDEICSDDDKFTFDIQWGGGKTKKCDFFRFDASKTEMRVLNHCGRPSIAEACRKSCGTCTCADNPKHTCNENHDDPTIQTSPPSVEGSSLPTSIPSEQDKICSDDDDFSFDIQYGGGKTKKCDWFLFDASKTEMRVRNHCGRPSIAEACQKSCETCACADNPTYKFVRYNGRKASCQWLQANNKIKRQARFCGSGKESPSDIALQGTFTKYPPRGGDLFQLD